MTFTEYKQLSDKLSTTHCIIPQKEPHSAYDKSVYGRCRALGVPRPRCVCLSFALGPRKSLLRLARQSVLSRGSVLLQARGGPGAAGGPFIQPNCLDGPTGKGTASCPAGRHEREGRLDWDFWKFEAYTAKPTGQAHCIAHPECYSGND